LKRCWLPGKKCKNPRGTPDEAAAVLMAIMTRTPGEKKIRPNFLLCPPSAAAVLLSIKNENGVKKEFAE
jgi:hypothetical protein